LGEGSRRRVPNPAAVHRTRWQAPHCAFPPPALPSRHRPSGVPGARPLRPFRGLPAPPPRWPAAMPAPGATSAGQAPTHSQDSKGSPPRHMTAHSAATQFHPHCHHDPPNRKVCDQPSHIPQNHPAGTSGPINGESKSG
jgi:hypothetical protein